MSRSRLATCLLAALLAAGCASVQRIRGTGVTDTKLNRELVDLCERYRQALEAKDGAALLALAHPRYFEDSGTPKADDDYGYEGLKQVIGTRLRTLRSLRYNIEYRQITFDGPRAQVQIRYDASYQIGTEIGDRWERKLSDKRIEFEQEQGRWLIIAGM